MTVHDLPAVNASLNALSGILLVCGYTMMRLKRIQLDAARAAATR